MIYLFVRIIGKIIKLRCHAIFYEAKSFIEFQILFRFTGWFIFIFKLIKIVASQMQAISHASRDLEGDLTDLLN